MLTLCDNCGGDGGWPSEIGQRWDVCPQCEGTGELEPSAELISLDDFDRCFGANDNVPPCSAA